MELLKAEFAALNDQICDVGAHRHAVTPLCSAMSPSVPPLLLTLSQRGRCGGHGAPAAEQEGDEEEEEEEPW